MTDDKLKRNKPAIVAILTAVHFITIGIRAIAEKHGRTVPCQTIPDPHPGSESTRSEPRHGTTILHVDCEVTKSNGCKSYLTSTAVDICAMQICAITPGVTFIGMVERHLHGLSSTGSSFNAGAWIMRRTRFGAIDPQTALAFLLSAAVCYAAWLTSIVFCASHGARPLLIASATFFPVGIVHGIGVWFGGW